MPKQKEDIRREGTLQYCIIIHGVLQLTRCIIRDLVCSLYSEGGRKLVPLLSFVTFASNAVRDITLA